jgi:2-polyprenyl-3-methyl-5-hydroxy-6-metoxy-1,4-benzoquinol methylase
VNHWAVGTDRNELGRQYGTKDRLQTRSAFWAPSAPGESPQDIAIEALRVSAATDILEIGCGTGQFAERMQRELGAQVLATRHRTGVPLDVRARAGASAPAV